MKKLLICLLLILCLVTVAGCSRSGEETTTLPPETTTAPPEATTQTPEPDTSEPATTEPVTEPTYSFFEIFGGDEPADALMLIVNEPDTDTLTTVNQRESVTVGEVETSFLLLPKNPGSRIGIQKIVYQNDEFMVTDVVYENLSTEEDFALLVHTGRPEGIPFLRIFIESEGQTGIYYVAYHGQEGTPSTEYVCVTELE